MKRFVMTSILFAVAFIHVFGVQAIAQPTQALSSQYPTTAVTKIFDQIFAYSVPKGFVPAFENAGGNQYIQELVLDGETVEKWTQMLTVTGIKGLASNPDATPQKFSETIAMGFKRACPSSFSATSLGTAKIGSHDSYGAVISCGSVNGAHSETALIIAIKGASDYYTIQWAERGSVSNTPIEFDAAKWVDRSKKLTPIRLCPIVSGEKSPYLSCSAHD